MPNTYVEKKYKSKNTLFSQRRLWHIHAASFFGNESEIEAKLLTSNDSFLILFFVRSRLTKQTKSPAKICPIFTVNLIPYWFLSCHVLCVGGNQVPENRYKMPYSKNDMKPWLILNSCTKAQNICYCLKTSRKYWPGLAKGASIALLKWKQIVLILFKFKTCSVFTCKAVYIVIRQIWWDLFFNSSSMKKVGKKTSLGYWQKR